MVMEDKRFDLTPRQILSHLLDIEKKSPREHFRIFQPTVTTHAVVSDYFLAEEAGKMLEFVGLFGYELDVTYAKTAIGTGGDCVNNGPERVVHIHVSDSFRTDWKASMAVLAHEICHKLLFVKGLNSPISMMNEVYAELATIYFGFGELILEGYQAEDHCLGYLKPDTYKKINLLVCVVCGNIKSDVLNLKDIDPLADEVIDIWEKEEEKRSLLINCFKDTEKQISEYYRNICLLNQIQEKLKEDLKGDYERLDKLYFENFINTNYTRLEAFLFVYDNYCAGEYKNARVSLLSETLNESIFALVSKYQEQGDLKLKYDYICPVCGTIRENKQDIKGISVKKCPTCGKHITFNTEEWNATVFQRKVIRKEIAEINAINKKVEEYKRLVKNEADDAIRNVQNKASRQINALQHETAEKIDEIKRNEQQRCKEEILNRIPSYLRWMVAKYFKD